MHTPSPHTEAKLPESRKLRISKRDTEVTAWLMTNDIPKRDGHIRIVENQTWISYLALMHSAIIIVIACATVLFCSIPALN